MAVLLAQNLRVALRRRPVDDVGAGVRAGVVVDGAGLFAQRMRASVVADVGVIGVVVVAVVVVVVVFRPGLLLTSGGHVAIIQIVETLSETREIATMTSH